MYVQTNSPFTKLRKTTKGKGRHFLTAKEGAGMTAAGRAAYKRETGGNLKAPQPQGALLLDRRVGDCAVAGKGPWKGWKMANVAPKSTWSSLISLITFCSALATARCCPIF